MILQTGGFAFGATATRSRSASAATRSASSIRTMPTCSPPGPINRTSGTRMRSLTRGSVLMGPPYVVFQILTNTGNRREQQEKNTPSAKKALRKQGPMLTDHGSQLLKPPASCAEQTPESAFDRTATP